jgi:hypothetical protein
MDRIETLLEPLVGSTKTLHVVCDDSEWVTSTDEFLADNFDLDSGQFLLSEKDAENLRSLHEGKISEALVGYFLIRV